MGSMPIRSMVFGPDASHSSNGEDRGLLLPRYGFKSCMRHPAQAGYKAS